MGKQVNRRQALLLLASPAALALLNSRTASAAAAAPAAKQPKKGGVLTLAHTSDIVDFDPSRIAGGNWPMFRQVYNVLVHLDGNQKPQSELAESWQFSSDYRTLTLKLRQGVKFHSGREFTAEDVVYNIKRVQDAKLAANVRLVALNFKEVEAKDKYTVVCRFDSFYAPVMDLFDSLYIIDREAEADIKKKGVGTGPFKVESWQPGDHIRLVRNGSYWREGQPYLDEVIIRVMPDEQSMVIGVESGAVHIAEGVPPREWARFQKAGKLSTIKGPIGQIVNLLMNTSKPPLDNKKVRQGIAAAIDRKQYVDLFLLGASEPYCAPFPPGSLAYDEAINKSCLPDFDLGKAKRLIAEGGYPNGFELSILTGVPTSAPYSKEISEKLQADLKQIGVKLNIVHVEAAENARRLVGSEFELASTNFSRFHRDPATLFGSSIWFNLVNVAKFKSPEYEGMIREAESQPDPQKRREVYKKLNRFVIDEAWVNPLFPRFLLFALQPYVQGLKWSLEGYETLEGVWLDK